MPGSPRKWHAQPAATWIGLCWILLGVFGPVQRAAAQQGQGGIGGITYARDFDMELAGVRVEIVQLGLETVSGRQGEFLIQNVPPGSYTLVFSKPGYLQTVQPVTLARGQLLDLGTVSLAGDFVELEYTVQDIVPPGTGSDAALLQLRLESPSLLDSIGSSLMSAAGASDAAAALKLVPGASLKDGKSAVIRGLPDRYISSQINGVRVPSANEDKRAVELDQFPSAVIEAINVSKTFTPDQQGDASGGAVDVRLKGIPDDPLFLRFSSQIGFNSQVTGRDDFLTYDDAGVGFFDQGEGRGQQEPDTDWDGAMGVKRGRAPIDSKWSAALGGSHEWEDRGVRVGGFVNFFHERDSSFYDDGINDSYWVDMPGEGLTPEKKQQEGADTFKTALFDVTEGKESAQWGGLATFGVETDRHFIGLTYLSTRSIEDKATLAEDTRGKYFFYPDYDPDDPDSPGFEETDEAPWLRLETLQYTERTVETVQLTGRHTLSDEGFGFLLAPELDWTLARNKADLNQPDKRQFGGVWFPGRTVFGIEIPSAWRPFKPAANANLGNAQRIFKEINEDSDTAAANLKFPFEQWSGIEGYVKLGVFNDRTDRKFDQDTFSNFGDPNNEFEGSFEDYWSEVFDNEEHIIGATETDVDYSGDLDLAAWYLMADLPLTEALKLTGGFRVESTDIVVLNDPEEDAFYFPPNSDSIVDLGENPTAADVRFGQSDTLPSIGLTWEPWENVIFRSNYSETVARQTFKELTPVIQQEFLGGPIFVGNPELQMSALENYDLRLDYTPYEGGFVSLSWFHKKVEDPIEYVQRDRLFSFTTPVNYPEGTLSGYEVEVRQSLGQFWVPLDGFALGANGTFINSDVKLPEDEIDVLSQPGIEAPIFSRDMTNAPDYLYNLYMTYEVPATGTRFGLFYTVTGDTLIAGAGQAENNFIPNIYAKKFDSLNFSLTQPLGQYVSLKFQAKNLTDPQIETVYRSKYTGSDVTKTRFTAGVDYTVALTVNIPL